MEIETYYTPDGGHQDNVFNLSESEKRNRIVDLIDVVKDQAQHYSSNHIAMTMGSDFHYNQAITW